MSTKNNQLKRKITEIDSKNVVNYFYRSTILNAMFFGYVHSHLTLKVEQSLRSIAVEFIASFCADNDDITEEQLVRNYYRFLPKFKESIKS